MPRLTEMVASAGCAAKLGPMDLSVAVRGLFDDLTPDPNVLVGFGTLDDAGVYRLGNQGLVQTVDFIPPVVDDPFTYGEIAVTNALSDVYTMGGQPLTALNIACFPSTLDGGIFREILRGGLAKLTEAGVALMGGHTVDDPVIKYGVSVTGLVDPDHILTNAGARPGDVLILTKAIGVGVLTTALKWGEIDAPSIDAAVQSMRTLNRAARNAIVANGAAHACTDVTGFSLMGHLCHMVRASGVTAQIDAESVPFLPHARELSARGAAPGGTHRNRAYFGAWTTLAPDLDDALINLLFDPQTSGGLLVAVPAESAENLLREMAAEGVNAAVIGRMTEPSAGHIVVGV
jgi:selenide,water dikinase